MTSSRTDHHNDTKSKKIDDKKRHIYQSMELIADDFGNIHYIPALNMYQIKSMESIAKSIGQTDINTITKKFITQIKQANAIKNKLQPHYAYHRFNAYVELFFEIFGDDKFHQKLTELSILNSNEKNKIIDEKRKNLILEQIKTFKKNLALDGFKEKIKSAQRACNKNKKGLDEYISRLFDNCSKLLVIRLDLSYNKQEINSQMVLSMRRYGQLAMPLKFEPDCFSVEEVISHREKFFLYLKKDFKQSLKGYVWKIEYGEDKGFHYHTIIFLDGSKHRQDVSIGKKLGDHWSSEITSNKGLYYNCNANKNIYNDCSIGMQEYSNEDLWIGMGQIIDYFTKPDLYVKMELPNNHRTFGKGVMPKIKTTKRGRPRSKEPQLLSKYRLKSVDQNPK